MNEPTNKKPSKGRQVRYMALAGAAVGAIAAVGIGVSAVAGNNNGLQAKIQAHFPNTKVTSVKCGREALPKDLCEVVAGANVFYTTPDGRLAFIGSILDLEEKRDLTDSRLRELAAVQSAADKLGGAAAPAPTGAGGQAAAPTGPQRPGQGGEAQVVRVTLPKENAIVHNPGAPLKMTVFTDLNCSYCNKLMSELRGSKDIEVTEFPIAILGPESAQKAKMVLCSSDKKAAADAAYFGGEIKTSGDCADAERRVQQNSQFAQQNGIQGTPAIIRGDGVMNGGWMPQPELRAFLGQARS